MAEESTTTTTWTMKMTERQLEEDEGLNRALVHADFHLALLPLF